MTLRCTYDAEAGVFYIGGFKPSISGPKLTRYVTKKGVPVTWISIRRYEKQNKAVIRLNVVSDLSYVNYWNMDSGLVELHANHG